MLKNKRLLRSRLKASRNEILSMSNWKALGPDGVQGFWFKRMTNLHDRLAKSSLFKYWHCTPVDDKG